jgi:hypothetical protein
MKTNFLSWILVCSLSLSFALVTSAETLRSGAGCELQKWNGKSWAQVPSSELGSSEFKVGARKNSKGLVQFSVSGDWFAVRESCLLAAATSEPSVEPVQPENASPAPASTSGENWYWGFTLGYAVPMYPSVLKGSIDSLKNSGATRTPLGIDLYFYWPLQNQTSAQGVVARVLMDRYSVGANSLSINMTSIHYGWMGSLGDRLGEGLQLKAEAGFASLGLSVEGSGTNVTAASQLGFGGAVGLAYGIPMSTETRLLVDVGYAGRYVESEFYGALTFGLGVLF